MRNGGWNTRTLAGWTMQRNVHGRLRHAAHRAGRRQSLEHRRHWRLPEARAPKPPAFPSPAAAIPTSIWRPSPRRRRASSETPARDTIPGPFQVSFNAALNRAFRFGETRRQLQLRLSATNALNHVAITSFGTTVNSATYGLADRRFGHAHGHVTLEVQLLMQLSESSRVLSSIVASPL